MIRRFWAASASVALLAVIAAGPAWAQTSSSAEASSDGQTIGDRVVAGSDHTRLINNPTYINLDWSNADIREVLDVLGKKGGMNLLIDNSVQGKVTVSLKAVPLADALDLVLRMHDLEAKRVGGTLLIATREVWMKKHFGGYHMALLRIDNSEVEDIEGKIRQVFLGDDADKDKNIKLIADKRTNSLLIVAPEDLIDKISALVKALDVPTRQVLIEVKMIEIKKGDQNKIGLHYGFGGSKFGWGWDNNGFAASNGAANQAGNLAPDSSTALTFNALGNVTANFNARLDWAVQNNYATVLANPKVAAQDNKKASINISNKYPIVKSTIDSSGHGVSDVSFIDVGQQLELTPRIDSKGFVTLDLKPTISVPGQTAIVNGNPVPIVDSRSVETTMRVKDGESIVIGGLKRKDTVNSVTKMPLLGDIPIFGRLFQTTAAQEDESEIIIVVTPQITTRLAPSQENVLGITTP